MKNNNPKKKVSKNKVIQNKQTGYQNKQQPKSLLSPFQTALSPVILKSQHKETLQPIGDQPLMKGFLMSSAPSSKIMNYRKMGRKDSHYYFSTNGNHYTHWENMPFRLDAGNSAYHFRKPKKDLCNIL